MTRDEALAVLAGGDFEQFIGVPEGLEVEFKAEPYQIEHDSQRFELAKDVSALANAVGGVIVIGARTARDDEGRFLTAGGRVLSVTGVGADLAEARARAYQGVDGIHFDGAHHRTDIAAHAVEGARA